MDSVAMLIFLCFTMLIGSFVAGLLPLALTLSESKMRHITILGAGLLIGTALAVIIPEGVNAIYSNPNQQSHSHSSNKIADAESLHEAHHRHKRGLSDLKQTTKNSIELQLDNSLIFSSKDRKIDKRLTDDEQRKMFLSMISEANKNNKVLNELNEDDSAKLKMFLLQIGKNNLKNDVLKRSLDNEMPTLSKRTKRLDEKANLLELVKKGEEKEQIDDQDHSEHSNHNAHSAIGVTLVLGFIFMLIVDQIGGKISHRHHPSKQIPR